MSFIYAPQTLSVVPLLTSNDGLWTFSNFGGGTSPTLNTGAGSIDFAVNANGNGSKVERTLPVFSGDWRSTIRLGSFTDTTTNVSMNFLPNWNDTSQFPAFGVRGDGSMKAAYTNTDLATIAVRAYTGAQATIRTALDAGTLWLRVQSRGGVMSWQYAIGSTYANLVWVIFAAYTLPGTGIGERPPTIFNCQLARGASSGSQTATITYVSFETPVTQ